MAKSLGSSKSLRAGLRAAGKLDRWDNEKRQTARGYSPHDVRIHCVENSEWQKIRLSMKGVDTTKKLSILEAWWDKRMKEAENLIKSNFYASDVPRGKALKWATEVQVGNYLGAIRRGGQLDDENRIRKAR